MWLSFYGTTLSAKIFALFSAELHASLLIFAFPGYLFTTLDVVSYQKFFLTLKEDVFAKTQLLVSWHKYLVWNDFSFTSAFLVKTKS